MLSRPTTHAWASGLVAQRSTRTRTVGCRRGSGGGSVGVRAPTEAPVVRVEELQYVDTPEMFYCEC